MTTPAAHSRSRTNASAQQELSAGPVRASFYGGDLRYLRVGRAEVVRRVNVAVRDTGWGTVEPVLSEVQINGDTEGFAIEYDARHAQGDIDFSWHATIRGTSAIGADGTPEATITFEMDGVAGSTFKTNRTGFCVLHPLRGCAGEPCVIEHPDGSRETARFPKLISSRQPFFDVSAMEQHFAGGPSVAIRFEGEVFETEDQRNWADSSFKTYCRPLKLPFPYVLEKGQRVRQSVTLRIAGHAAQADDAQVLRLHDEIVGRLPPLGLRLAGPRQPLSEIELARLKALRLSHGRTDVRLSDAAWRASLSSAAADAAKLQVPLEMAVFCSARPDAALSTLGEAARRVGFPVCRWIVYEEGKAMPSAALMGLARRHLGVARGSPVVPGTAGSFSEVNRRGADPELRSGFAYTINPQLHATDDLTVIENLDAQADTVTSARALAPDAPVYLSPVTLHRRPDPFAGGKSGEEEPPVPDPRQRSPLGAAWTLGSIASLSQSPPDSLTYYDTTGPFGVMEGGQAFPLYQVLADVAEFGRAEVLRTTGFDPLKLAVLALRQGHRLRLLVASFGEAHTLPLSGLDRFRLVGGDLPKELTVPAGTVIRFDFERAE